jgi:cell wall-associated NlpC family hydrolase
MRAMRCLAIALLALLASCASAPQRPASSTSSAPSSREVSAGAADKAATQAAGMIGKPYRFGGASPSSGFDCSGLVMYSFRQAGVRLPHNTDQQRAISRHVRVSDLRRGDLLFFDQEGKKNSHVGIYLGRGMFVHAPSSGKTVRSDRIESPYWKKHLSEVRRLAV